MWRRHKPRYEHIDDCDFRPRLSESGPVRVHARTAAELLRGPEHEFRWLRRSSETPIDRNGDRYVRDRSPSGATGRG
jgi:hypothetical protein